MSAEQGDLLAEIGMAAAEAGAHEGWLRAARHTIGCLIAEGVPFTTDTVWFRLEALGVKTSEPRALGSLMRSATKSGLIRQGGYVKTTRPEAHARPIPVWVPVMSAQVAS